LPGGANGGDHSGTNSGKAELWKSKKNLELATRCLLFIAHEAQSMDGVVGLQLINEADWDAPGMYGWYDSVIGQIGGIDNTVPLYISDAWNLGPAVGYVNGKNSLHAGRANPIVIDTHLYWAFSDDDKKKNPSQIANEARSKLSELDGHDGNVVDKGAAQVIIGEYSCVLTEDSWAKAAAHEKDNLVREFGQAQTQRYQQRTGGSFFWTYRMVRFVLSFPRDIKTDQKTRTGWMVASGASSNRPTTVLLQLLTTSHFQTMMFSLVFNMRSPRQMKSSDRASAVTATTGIATIPVITSTGDTRVAGSLGSTTQ
jgi:hypothetical protein